MKKFKDYLKDKIEGCESTNAPHRDKLIYQLVLQEYTEIYDEVNRELLTDFMEHYRDNDGMCKRDGEAINDFLLNNKQQ